jgi:hypothetical protein
VVCNGDRHRVIDVYYCVQTCSGHPGLAAEQQQAYGQQWLIRPPEVEKSMQLRKTHFSFAKTF